MVGKIYFYDSKQKRRLRILSRGSVDSLTADQVFTNNEYDLNWLSRKDDIQNRYDAILLNNRVPLIVDCGGNIGLASNYYSAEYPEAKIICVEPEFENHKLATSNCSDCENVEVKQAAIGSESGFASITNEDADPNAFQVQPSKITSDISMISIEGIEEEYGDCTLFLVKVDIEGFEHNLFSSNTNWIDRCAILIIELHDWMLPKSANSANFLKAVSDRDRDFVFRGENVFSIKND